MFKLFALALLVFACAALAPEQAAAAGLQGDLCYVNPMGIVVGDQENPTFMCNKSGLKDVTISEIYDKGWQVTSISQGGGYYPIRLIIEKQR